MKRALVAMSLFAIPSSRAAACQHVICLVSNESVVVWKGRVAEEPVLAEGIAQEEGARYVEVALRDGSVDRFPPTVVGKPTDHLLNWSVGTNAYEHGSLVLILGLFRAYAGTGFALVSDTKGERVVDIKALSEKYRNH